MATNFPENAWPSPEAFPDTRQLLSGGDWLTHSGKRSGESAYARYEVQVPREGSYHLWTRKYWLHGPFRWRFDDAPWRTCGRDIALADTCEIITHVCANWVYLGNVDLEEGPHAFTIELLAGEGEDQTAAFDAFLLTPGYFEPRGALKPGETSGLADPGFFAWEPGTDPLSGDALLDLRRLNEAEAGQSGSVRREGDRLLLGDGTPVRFWGVNVGPGVAALDDESLAYLARRLAKLGVNLVRCHGPAYDQSAVVEPRMDPKTVGNIQRLVAALKKEGIYTAISFYFPLWVNTDTGHPFARIYFDPDLQAAHRFWARGILSAPNPHTGKPLAQEPAVALVELVNEDSLFFWTCTRETVGESHWAALESRFAQWLAETYGSVAAAQEVWGHREPEDSEARVKLYDAWFMTGDARNQMPEGQHRRMQDQARFYTELQAGFYGSTRRFLRNELGLKCPVVASNWHTADPRFLGPLERFTYTACDVIDQHGYFSPPHEGEGSGYSVRRDHTFESQSALFAPAGLPIQANQVDGFPQMISEYGWPHPNLYRQESVFLAGCYSALQGVDAICQFAIHGPSWDQGMQKFAMATPSILGTFPAQALIFRKGLVPEGQPAVETLDMAALYRYQGGGNVAGPALDALRQADVPVEVQPFAGASLAHYRGPVQTRYQEIVREGKVVDPRRGEVLQSGGLRWDTKAGIVTANTPQAQGAMGFIGQAPVVLPQLGIRIQNDYASAALVSLDGLPLATSQRMLLQVMTVDRPYGFRASKSIKEGRIEQPGSGPFGVERIHGFVTFDKDTPLEATALDGNGYAAEEAVPVKDGVLPLAEDTVYYILTRG